MKEKLTFFLKGAIGFTIVLLLFLFSRSDNYYIAGLIPLFPSFGIIAQIIVYKNKGIKALKETILFSMFSLIPYFVYLLTLYISIGCINFYMAIILSVLSWSISAYILIFKWKKMYYTKIILENT